MYPNVATLVAVISSLSIGLTHAVSPLVDVGNTKYLGTALPNGISQWLGVRYAAPPLGDLRFRAPADPPVNNTVQVADTHGAVCFATGTGFPESGHSEDCLFLDVYAPSNATVNSKLPVMFFIQGGGLNELSNANYNASGLIQAADMDIVVVTHNYRVGPYGFLASKEIQSNGSLNVGLLDQRKAMQWVQDHISQFGGDPGHVALAGDSAGAQSITHHLTAFSGAPTTLFHAVIGESQSFPPTLNVSEAQFQYNALVERVGCANSTNDSLSCLRGIHVSVLQANNIAIPFPGRENSPNFLYNTVVDGNFVADLPLRLFENGKFVKVPSVFGDDTNEGTKFTPTNLSTALEMDSFMQDNFPNLNNNSLDTINKLYLEGEQFANHSAFFSAAAAVYGEMRYICPGIYISGKILDFRRPNLNWLYHYNVTDPAQAAAGLGVPHTVEVAAIWGPSNIGSTSPPASYLAGQSNAAIIPIMQGYWSSFIRTFNPNTHRAAGAPEWVPFDGKARILFETNATRMETIPSDQQERCDFLANIAFSLEQ